MMREKTFRGGLYFCYESVRGSFGKERVSMNDVLMLSDLINFIKKASITNCLKLKQL